MKTTKKIIDGVSIDPCDYALYGENGKKLKDFDCVVMKRKLQAIVQERTKDMTTEERITYFRTSPEKTSRRSAKDTAKPCSVSTQVRILSEKESISINTDHSI